jgi:hypothetical protein
VTRPLAAHGEERRVSIVDAQSRPVVHYLPDDSVTVVEEENR